MSFSPEKVKELIQLSRGGDIEAFNSLIKDVESSALNILLSKNVTGENQEELEEALQDARIQSWKYLKGFKEDSQFHTWYYSILFNAYRKRINQKKKRNETFLSCEDNDIRGFVLNIKDKISQSPDLVKIHKEKQAEAIQTAKKVLKKLSPNFSAILSEYYLKNKDFKTISRDLGIPMGTVCSRISVARKRAKEVLKKNFGLFSLSGV